MNDAITPGPILLASDLTAVSDNVARVAVELAARTGAVMSTVHVLTDSELEAAKNQLPEDQAFVDVVFEQVRQDLSAQIDRVGGTGAPVTPRALGGEPGAELLSILHETEHSFVVIGVRSRSRIGKFILGSVTQEVLLRSPCPVVAVPI